MDSKFKLSNIYIAGGAISSYLRNETPNDLDFYVLPLKKLSYGNFLKDTKRYYDYSYAKGLNYEKVVNRITETININKISAEKYYLTVNSPFQNLMIKLQIMISEFPTIEEATDHFDLLHTQAYYSFNTKKLTISRPTFDAIMKKELRLSGTKKPLDYRVEKYLKQGFSNHMAVVPIADFPENNTANVKEQIIKKLVKNWQRTNYEELF